MTKPGLSTYLPEKAVPVISRWIDVYQVQLRISRPRRSKLGDYRSPVNGGLHRISVNRDLNPYAFLLTLVHEFAHLVTWNHYGFKVHAHGKEWKGFFREMMQPFMDADIFPDDILEALRRYMKNPAAASCSDMRLLRVLKSYDPAEAGSCTVEQLPEGSVFDYGGNGGSKRPRAFKKGPRLRKRYRCTELGTGRIYLFNALAEVKPIE